MFFTWERQRDCKSYFHNSQVRPREPTCGFFLTLLRCVDVWRDAVGDVHLLRGALVRADRQTGTCMSTTCDICVVLVPVRGIRLHPGGALFCHRDSGFWFSSTFPRLNPDLVASRAGGRAVGETTRLPTRDLQRHEKVLGLQPCR